MIWSANLCAASFCVAAGDEAAVEVELEAAVTTALVLLSTVEESPVVEAKLRTGEHRL
jgi:hypothetical protein